MNLKTVLICCAGFLMLALGLIGIFLPIWPTTPFILVASGCFASVPALYSRILKIPFVNEYIKNYKDRRGVSRKTVAVSLIFLWVMLLIPALRTDKLWLMCLLALIGIAVTIHILLISRPGKRGRDD